MGDPRISRASNATPCFSFKNTILKWKKGYSYSNKIVFKNKFKIRKFDFKQIFVDIPSHELSRLDPLLELGRLH